MDGMSKQNVNEHQVGDLILLTYREDFTEYQEKVKISFKSLDKPYKWVYWVYDTTDNWINRKDFMIN